MSKITYELFGRAAEIVKFDRDRGTGVIFEFGCPVEGLISIDGVVSRVTEGRCVFDSRLIDPGEWQPILITKDAVIKLPALLKSGGNIRLADCTDEYTRDISLRERRLSMKVEALEKELRNIQNKISRTIF